MKQALSLTFCLFLLSFTAAAQRIYSVKGSVADTVSNHQLVNTSISVLRSKDSTLVRYTRAGENGTFSLSNLPKGKLFLLVTYPGYADYVEHFTLDSTKSTADFGTIKLTLKATLLANVIIKAKAAAIKIKGDTTEFNASSFNIEPNSKVEDLLKQLPGIQVDKDGKITAQGQKVSKVLLDGEEFFGDDPTLVTKNIRADMVDKVQLFDKTSDQAAFTGIDDGKKTKTINIKLKNSKKDGYFGKLDAGYGTDKYYQEQAMFNAFKDKKKFSVYGTLANTGKTGLGWDDASKYGASSDNIEMMDGGGIMFTNNSDGSGLDGQYNNEGIPVARTGGTHYDAKWNSDKESVNANYKLGMLRVQGVRTTETQNNLATGTIVTSSNELFNDYILRQKLDGTYTVKLDSTSDLKVSVDGTRKNTTTNSDFTAGSMRGNDVQLTNSLRSLSNDGHSNLFNAKALYTKKFKKKGRTLSVDLNESVTHSENTGFLNSTIDYFNDAGTKDSTQVVNQYKTSLIKSNVFKSSLVYTEPLTKKVSLALSYGLGLNNSSTNSASFNQDPSGKYTALDSLYSTNYKFDQTSNQAGAFLNIRNTKSTINVGTKVADVSFDQTNLYDNTYFKRTFINWNPKVDYRYKFAQQKSLSVSYSGTTIQPQITQIQPLLNNTDPLNITLGNPDLKPSFQHSFHADYNSYKVLSNRYIYFSGNYNFITNPIVSNSIIDSAGKSTFQSVNLTTKKSNSISVYGGIGQKIFAEMDAGLRLSMSTNNSYNYVNNVLNKNQSATYSPSLNVQKYIAKKFSFYVDAGPTYTQGQSSIQKEINNNGWGFRGFAQTTVIRGKYEFRTDGDYQYTAPTESFNTSFHRFIWNATLIRKFTKSEGLKLSVSANDLLNQNKGFSRTSSGSVITQSGYTTIRRYFMASLSWDFSKMGGALAKKL